MRGEFLGIGSLLMTEVFEPLFEFIAENDIEVEDLWLDILQSALPRPVPPVAPTYQSYNENGELHLPEDLQKRATYKAATDQYQAALEVYMDASTDDILARDYIHSFFDAAPSEHAIVETLEKTFKPFDDAGGDHLSNAYFVAVQSFIEKYSLRYDVRRPSYNRGMSIYPTLPGLFTKMLRELKASTTQDPDLAELMSAFEETIIDLRDERSPTRVKRCIAAQFNLLEALLAQHPDIVSFNDDIASGAKPGKEVNTFGAMCDTAKVWPHAGVLNSAKELYRFASDYPGIRHGGKPKSKKREIDMRDLLSMSVVLTGLFPYLNSTIDPEKIYLD